MKKTDLIPLFGAVLILAALVTAKVLLNKNHPGGASQPSNNPVIPSASSTAVAAPSLARLALPFSDAISRITKKPFGLYVTPQNSPVQPERFKGYHTGVDFETYPNEQNIDVPVSAVCSGKLLVKKQATGYGGVAVEACKLNGQDVTVVYGHLRLSSIKTSAGQQMQAGERFAVLGTGYSKETDGERKHLHLGIHKGAGINILGYVQNQKDLSNWLNAQDYF